MIWGGTHYYVEYEGKRLGPLSHAEARWLLTRLDPEKVRIREGGTLEFEPISRFPELAEEETTTSVRRTFPATPVAARRRG